MDFQFLHDPYNNQWVAFAPHRATRPDEFGRFSRVCDFCPGNEEKDTEVYRLSANPDSSWSVLVVKNKFPFAPIHEVIIHSPDHHKNFDTLPLGQTEKIFQVYQQRYTLYREQGNVVIFHNYGPDAGASVVHPHSQVVVVPKHIHLHVPGIPFFHLEGGRMDSFKAEEKNSMLSVGSFSLFCPQTSQWPDEVWILPKQTSTTFGDVSKEHLRELSHILARVIQLLDARHGKNFSFNFYIAPWKNWYLRIIPRVKKPGGFELATGVYVNTQDPKETIAFLREHFT